MDRHHVRRYTMFIRSLVVLLALGGLGGRVSEAATVIVTSLADSGRGTLRRAIATATAGDTITFDSTLFPVGGGMQTIVLTTGELLVNKDLTIEGPGRLKLAISGNKTSRVFHIAPNVTVRLRQVTIKHGKCVGCSGGGIWNEGTLRLTDSRLSRNTADFAAGGGMYNFGGTVTITDSTLRDNSVTVSPLFHDGGDGGGVYNFGGMVTITGSTLRDNSAATGGGVYNEFGMVTITGSTLCDNSAGDGGGVYNEFGMVTITGSTLCDNSADSEGGGVYNYYGPVTIRHSTLRGNTAIDSGGGVYNHFENSLLWRITITDSTLSGNTASEGGGVRNYRTLTIRRSTLSGNTATTYGGGVRNSHYGTLIITGSTLSDNSAGSDGGGVHHSDSGTIRLRATILAGNTAGSTATDCNGNTDIKTRGRNLTGAGTGCPSDGTLGDRTVDPTDVFTTVLGPLQDNGGPTFTHALLPGAGNPALDVIDPAVDPTVCHGTDQRGIARPQGPKCDIGAFELEVP